MDLRENSENLDAGYSGIIFFFTEIILNQDNNLITGHTGTPAAMERILQFEKEGEYAEGES